MEHPFDKAHRVNKRVRSPRGVAKWRNRYVEKTYGLTPKARKELYVAQNGSCAVCAKKIPEWGHDTHIDHCHSTGAVRGILCMICNTRIAWFEKVNVENVLAYLRR